MSNVDEDTPQKRTKKQELWCKFYVANGHNGTQAAIDAGYSEHTAKQIAAENLSKPYLLDYIKQLEKPIFDKLELDENWVLTKLKRFSETNITDFFEIKTQKISTGIGKNKRVMVLQNIYVKNLSKLPRELTDSIQEISQTKQGIRIKLVDKRPCVIDIGRNLDMFKDPDSDKPIDINITINGLQKV